VSIFTSPHADVEIPDVALTPHVLERAGQLGDKPALIDGPSGRTLTYAQLEEEIRRFAGGLVELGFSKGDVLALYSPNLPEYAVVWHGTAFAGGITTTVNPVYNTEELKHQLEDSGARFLVTVEPAAERAREAAEGTKVEQVFVIGDDLPRGEPLAEQVEVSPAEDLAALPYSSGTTGLPKGVMLTHRNLVANLEQTQALFKISDDDALIAVLPFFHIYGMQVIMNLGLIGGAKIVTMPRFDLEQFLTLIQEHKVTRSYIVPPIALGLAKHPLVDKFDLSSLKLAFSGAAPLGAELEEACAKRLGCRVSQGYGMTETSPVTHAIPLDEGAERAGSIGPALPNTECRIVDVDSGEDLGVGERGELWIKGPHVMAGYWNNEEATRETVDEDGWLHTGDIAVVDEDGYFAIVDRLKELIKFKGFQVAPAELEALLLSHEGIADAAVIPLPDEEAGEIPKAFVVPAPGAEIGPEDVMEFVKSRVSTYKQVRQCEIIDEIPKSPSGKILRRVLKDREAAAT
jgi:acyl-CoA synthetase (AMP-forming)/AMP-acid ligase II